jgi:hypothetical protein
MPAFSLFSGDLPQTSNTMTKLQTAIQHAINCASAENGSDTPDFILAEYLIDCLAAYDRALVAREKWYGRECGGLKRPIPVDGPPPPDSENVQAHSLGGVAQNINEAQEVKDHE